MREYAPSSEVPHDLARDRILHEPMENGASQGLTEVGRPVLAENIPQQFQENERIYRTYTQAIQALEPYVRATSDGRLEVDARNGSEVHLDEQVFSNLVRSAEYASTLIQTRLLNPHDVLLRTDTRVLTDTQGEARTYVTAAGTCVGRSGIDTGWWGAEAYANECQVQDVINLLKVGATAAQISSALGFSYGALISGIISAGAGLLQFIDGWGNNHGLEFGWTWIGGVFWIWHQ